MRIKIITEIGYDRVELEEKGLSFTYAAFFFPYPEIMSWVQRSIVGFAWEELREKVGQDGVHKFFNTKGVYENIS